ncbi:odorant receptor 82a [Stomoxys calcitrans]|uniref:Odorant receptor n=1 Tax=Stomoxys calcitrans TaxID=35570 RepID=A0A1I8PW35_STOCA|nr:odorant receptor 82a [Stomoxys calcitrans]
MIDLFARQRQCLVIMGHHFVRDKSRLLQQWRNIKYVGVLLLVMSAQGPMINYTIYHIDDLQLATASLSISFTNVLTVIKITTFLLYKWRFVALTRKLETMYQELQEDKAKEELEASNRYATTLVKIYYMSVSSTGMYFMVAPILKMLWSKLRGTQLDIELPMPMRFPFDFESSPGYEVCYIYTGLVTLAVVMYAVAIDGLFLSFTINLVAHLKILQHYIKTNTFKKSDQELQSDVSFYVRYHNIILDLYKEIRDVYAPIVFGQFLMTSLQVCVIVYQMVTHINTYLVFVINSTFLCSILLQLFIYCYGGEILKVESLMVGISVQLSNWYNLKPTHRRMLCLLMQRSQREAIIKAGFYEASLANFMAILRAALSYITLIQSIE